MASYEEKAKAEAEIIKARPKPAGHADQWFTEEPGPARPGLVHAYQTGLKMGASTPDEALLKAAVEIVLGGADLVTLGAARDYLMACFEAGMPKRTVVGALKENAEIYASLMAKTKEEGKPKADE